MLSAFLITLGPLSSGCGFLTFKQPYSVSFFVTRGGVPASGVVIMSIINCVEPSYKPGEEVAKKQDYCLNQGSKNRAHEEGCRTQNLVNHNPRRSMLSSRRRGGTPGPGGRAQSARRENTKYRHWARRQRSWKKSYGARDCSQAFFFFTLRSALICRPFLASLEI